MKKRILGAFFLTAGLFGTSAQAADAFDLEQLKQLFNTYQRQQAYDYANRYLGEMEGDSNFDYLYGVSAIDSGHASQGVFALERVLIQFPDDHVTRLELGRGYFILEEYARARLEFEKVLAINPPQGVIDTTQSFLDQIRLKEARYRTTTGGFVALGLGSDSNVASGPDSTNPFGGGTPLSPLSETSIKQSDNYTDLSVSWGIGHPIAPGWMITANINASLRQNQEWDIFNTNSATLQAGLSRIYKDSRYTAEFLYQQFTVDYTESGVEVNNRNMSGLNLEWQYSITQKSKLNTALQYLVLAYPNDETRDSTMSTLSFSYKQNINFKWSPEIFIDANLGQETPADNDSSQAYLHDRSIFGFRIGSTFSLDSRFALQMALGMQTSDYPEATYYDLNLNPFVTSRQDDLSTANLTLLWLINKDWRLDTKLDYSKNDSNVALYSFDRTIIGIEANYSF